MTKTNIVRHILLALDTLWPLFQAWLKRSPKYGVREQFIVEAMRLAEDGYDMIENVQDALADHAITDAEAKQLTTDLVALKYGLANVVGLVRLARRP